MKSVRKSNLFTTSLIMLFFFSLIGFWGCEKGELFGKDYSEHLDLGTFELSKMSEKDMTIMSQALQRLDIDIKEGLYHVKQTVLLNLYSTIIFVEKKLWIVQDVEA